jgi:hypothetical protein
MSDRQFRVVALESSPRRDALDCGPRRAPDHTPDHPRHGYGIVEAYPDDRYFPSYLLLGRTGDDVFHVLFGADVGGRNVRVVTAYVPSPEEWEPDLKTRRRSS